MSFALATGLAALLLAVDLAVRAWRIQLVVRGVGGRLAFRDALALNALGDAASALTPMRIGGEPARLAGLVMGRVPPAAALLAMGLEVMADVPVTAILAALVAWWLVPGWWDGAGRAVLRALPSAWYWVAGLAAVALVAWWAARRLARLTPAASGIPAPRLETLLRGTRWRVIATSVPLSALNVALRVAILPVLALSLPSRPDPATTIVGSFVLLYGQLALPMPSGVGAVELGFLGGLAGNLGADEQRLLLAWRVLTTGVGLAAGVAVAWRRVGWRGGRRLLGLAFGTPGSPRPDGGGEEVRDAGRGARPAEVAGDVGHGAGALPFEPPAVAGRGDDGRGEGGIVAGRHEPAVHPLRHHVADPVEVGSDHRQA